MNSKKKLWIIILALVLLIAGASVLYSKLSTGVSNEQLSGQEGSEQEKGSSQQQGKQKSKALDFAVYDKDGKRVGLSDYFGKPIVLNFWASWCGPCQMEMPDFEALYKERGDEINFLMVNLTDGSRETQEKADEYIREQGFTMPVYYDLDSDAANTYGAYSIPMTFFIDKDGYLVARATGALDSETLQEGIAMIE